MLGDKQIKFKFDFCFRTVNLMNDSNLNCVFDFELSIYVWFFDRFF